MGSKIVSIYQPNYLPPLHYIDRIMNSDVFVLLDDVQLNRRVGQAKANIAGRQGKITLTVPIAGGNRVMLNEAQWVDDGWREKHIRTLKTAYGYKEGTRAHKYISWVERKLTWCSGYSRSFSWLCDTMLRDILAELGWSGEYYVASRDEVIRSTKGIDPSSRMLEITSALGGTTYLCGEVAAKQYLDLDEFKKRGIDVAVQRWKPPVYEQRCKEFHPNLSVIDALIMVGPQQVVSMFGEEHHE